MLTLDRRLMVTLVAVLVLPAAACSKPAVSGGSGPSSANTASNTAGASASSQLDGSWTGTWTRTSPPPGTGSMTLVLHQDGPSIGGTIDVGGSACLTKGDVSGSITGSAISLHTVTPAVNGAGQATGDYQATLSGNKITGTLTVSCSVGIGVGTWEVSRG